MLYYYVAALIGLIIIIVGALIAVHALLDIIFFEDPLKGAEGADFEGFRGVSGFEDRGDKFQNMLRGLVTAGVGFPVFWWHLRHAQRADPPNDTV